jgi:hypothetical protein
VESPTNGNPAALDDDLPVGSDVKEDSAFDLLDEEVPAGDVLDDLPLEEAPIAAAPEALAELAPEPEIKSASDEETAALLAGGEVPAPAEKKKLGKAKGGKLLRGKKGKDAEAGGKEEPKAKPPKERKSKEKPPKEKPVAVPAGAGRGSITFVCSECYEEFLIPSSYSQEMVSCPECLHVGKRPDESFLRTVHLHKAGEKRSFFSAVIVATLLLVTVVALLWMNTPYGPAGAAGGTLSLALLGGSALLTAILIWLVVRFEGNRWEVYF